MGLTTLVRPGDWVRLSLDGRASRRTIQTSSTQIPIDTSPSITGEASESEAAEDDGARRLAGDEVAWESNEAIRLGNGDKAFDIIRLIRLTWIHSGSIRESNMQQNILQKILETKRKEVAALHKATTLEALQAAATAAPPALNFFSAVTKKPRRLLNLIAEVKRASPSAGVIRADFDPVAIARRYADAGADAISVLTDEQYFQGHLDYLRDIRAAVKIPLLRKDFLIDPWQVYQSRAAGADAVLLIAAALPMGTLMDMMILATRLRMTVLVEVHDLPELMGVRQMIGMPMPAFALLGINNRDLSTFRVDLDTTLRLAEYADLGDRRLPIVSESGIRTHQDVEKLAAAGVSAVLVGETLMRSSDIATAIDDLLGPMTT
jgi:indole-3-glycerol phosphate synthase